MSKVGVKLKINVSEIQKELLFKGNKGTYLDATVFIDLDQEDQYGNHGMITQDVSKESREARENGPILGNCKIFWKGEGQSSGQKSQGSAPMGGGIDLDSDIPF